METQETSQERREKKQRKKREKIAQHGRSLIRIYKNAILKQVKAAKKEKDKK